MLQVLHGITSSFHNMEYPMITQGKGKPTSFEGASATLPKLHLQYGGHRYSVGGHYY